MIGDSEFHLDRSETELNAAVPGDERNTSTPAAMGRSLRTLVPAVWRAGFFIASVAGLVPSQGFAGDDQYHEKDICHSNRTRLNTTQELALQTIVKEATAPAGQAIREGVGSPLFLISLDDQGDPS